MRLPWVAFALLVLLSSLSVLTAENVVGSTRAGTHEMAILVNELKPPECAALSLTARVTGSGSVTGTGAAELVVAGSGVDAVDGAGSDDCIVGGAGNDSLKGSGGNDVCIGGPGADTFDPDCETQIQ
jgi:Ca2+-binding RTX toxin-like protein